MTTIDSPTGAPAPTDTATPERAVPAPARPDDTAFCGLAADIGAVATEHADDHDRDATFVAEAYDRMRSTGYLALLVPAELGGLGATLRQACYAQAELARHDGATALAATMHLYLSALQAYRFRAGAPDAEGVLRRIVDEDLVMATSGGSDGLWPTTVAVVDGDDLVVTGRKAFCSQAPAATVVATSAVLDGPEPGHEVVHFAVPLSAPGVRIVETWDTLGMRGTASHDLVMENVRVPLAKVTGRRPWGEFAGPFTLALVHFAPLGGACYLGIAAGARDAVVDAATATERGPAALAALPRVHRQVGLMDAALRSAWWGVMGALDELGPQPAPTAANLATAMLAKRAAVLAARDAVQVATEVMGGRSYFRSSPLERAQRDVAAGVFHPLTPENTLAYAGKVALGDPGTTE